MLFLAAVAVLVRFLLALGEGVPFSSQPVHGPAVARHSADDHRHRESSATVPPTKIRNMMGIK